MTGHGLVPEIVLIAHDAILDKIDGLRRLGPWQLETTLNRVAHHACCVGINDVSRSRPFTLTTRKTGAGNTSRSCESLTQVIRKLHDQAGIEAAGATSARRTFGVRLHRAGYDPRHIREALRLATLSAAKALCSALEIPWTSTASWPK